MSFSSEVKQELAELTADKPCCRAALAYGLLEFGHAFTGSRMSLQTEHAAVAHLYSALAADVCGIAPPTVQTLPRRGGFCIVSVEGDAPRARVLERFGHSPADLAVRLNRANLECDGCAPALLRGAFLACGAVIDPASGYHMEFSVPYYNLCRDLLSLLRELGFHAKQVCRKGAQVVYLKESEQIEDCLTLMGATNAPAAGKSRYVPQRAGRDHGSAAEPIRHQPPAAPHCGTRGQAALTERNVMDYVRLRPSPCSQ